MKILLADDDEISLEIAQAVLESGGHQVISASDGEAAYEILLREDIQVLISDWSMPRLDGIELCRRLRSSATIGYIYIIVVTSHNSKGDLLTGLSAGADDFITKPFEPAELLLRVRNGERVLALETTSMMLFSLAKLAESKDVDTGFHLERIRNYTRLLATEMMKDPEIRAVAPPRFPDLLYETSPLHDIGKVAIPDHVLLKPGSLNDAEWQIMKRHAETGAETLNAALQKYPGREFLRIARDIAWAHHEWWNGQGYPRALQGEDIPLAARIMAVADVYDALTMKRVYKTAMTHEVARGIIVKENGTHFDPRVVEAFLAVEEEFIKTREGYID
jgi:putative two-component system response regulator